MNFYSKLHTLRDITAWISGQDLHRFSDIKTKEDLYSFSPATKKVAEAREYFLIYQLNGCWSTYNTPTEGMSFWEALDLSLEWKKNNIKSQIVPKVAHTIIESLASPKAETIAFSDGFMEIEGVLLPMCRWFSF